ncbi:MAG: multidrug resistance protein MdtN [candidate division BRC1 bacterium ADurb.BinA364]|nr:MAG: multidrug resistance protein MdtN [candidate division BRC1 bacterium ADurb.BinA364]
MDLDSFNRRIRWVKRILFLVLLFVFSAVASLAFISIDELYMASGIVRPADDAVIYSPCDGFIEKVYHWEEEYVPRGGELYRMESWDLEKRRIELQQQRRELEAQLAQQEIHAERVADTALPNWLRFADLDTERSEKVVEHRQNVLDRLEILRRDGLISQLEYDNAHLQLTEAETNRDRNQLRQELIDTGWVERAVAEANAAKAVTEARLKNLVDDERVLDQEFERRVVRADWACTITYVLVRHPGDPVREGQKLMEVRTSEERSLDLFGGERNVHRLAPGQKVIFETNAFSALTEGYCQGTVEIIASDANMPNSQELGFGRPRVAYYLKSSVDYSPLPLKFGATVSAEIALRRVPIYKVMFNLD